jgi:hypothetical protein
MSGASIGFGNPLKSKPLFISKSPSSSMENSSSFKLPAINEAESRILESRIGANTPKVEMDLRASFLQKSRNMYNSSEPERREMNKSLNIERKPSDKYLKFLLKHQYREENMSMFKGTEKIDEIPEGERGESKNISIRSTMKTPIREVLRESLKENEKYLRDS